MQLRMLIAALVGLTIPLGGMPITAMFAPPNTTEIRITGDDVNVTASGARRGDSVKLTATSADAPPVPPTEPPQVGPPPDKPVQAQPAPEVEPKPAREVVAATPAVGDVKPKPRPVKPKAEAPVVTMPEALTVPVGRLKGVPISSNGASTKYIVIGEADAFREYNPDPLVIQLKVIGYVKGYAWVVVYTAMADGRLSEPAVCKITIGDGPTPDPPGPGPEPNPPTPEPGKISVLFVDESSDYWKPEYKPYLSLFNSVALREYLNTHCGKDAKGTPEWRFYDKDTDLTNESKKWQDAMKIPRTTLPWIAITNGKTGFAGPVPKTEAEVLALLKKWGGE